MNISVQLTSEPISFPVPRKFPDDGHCGSEVEFQGKVRAAENGEAISGLFYEAYEIMAEKQIERLLLELASQVPCLTAEVTHRLGWVPVSGTSIYIRIRSTHRREGFQLLALFMDRLKIDVPIWKARSAPVA